MEVGDVKIALRATIDDVINTVVFQSEAVLKASHYAAVKCDPVLCL